MNDKNCRYEVHIREYAGRFLAELVRLIDVTISHDRIEEVPLITTMGKTRRRALEQMLRLLKEDKTRVDEKLRVVKEALEKEKEIR